jgi:hypothetical protein
MRVLLLILFLPCGIASLSSQEADSSRWLVGVSLFQEAPVGSFSSRSSASTEGNADFGASIGVSSYYSLDSKSAISFSAILSQFAPDKKELGNYYQQKLGSEFTVLEVPDLFYRHVYFSLGYQREIYKIGSDLSVLINPFLGVGFFNKESHLYSFNEQPFAENSNSIFLTNQTINSTYEVSNFSSTSMLIGLELAILGNFDFKNQDMFVLGQFRYSAANYRGNEKIEVADFREGLYVINEKATFRLRSLSVGATVGVRF